MRDMRKELDYDGYYLVSPPYAHLSPLVSHSPLRGTYGGERRTEEMNVRRCEVIQLPGLLVHSSSRHLLASYAVSCDEEPRSDGGTNRAPRRRGTETAGKTRVNILSFGE